MARFDLQDFKKQASFFLREKLKDARLALTDVSRMQLLTEEATNEDSWGPETRTMAMLADAAFELEEYERIVEVIHHRLEPSKKRSWRQLYKTLVVLEYLLTHGPNSLGKEFRRDSSCVEELSQFNFTDEQGIDRGFIIRNKADRVLDLINNPDVRKEERNRAMKISFGIRGFGSSMNQEPTQNAVEGKEEESWQGDISSNTASEEICNAAVETPQHGQKHMPYEKCASIAPQLMQNVSSNALSEESAITSQPSEGKGQMRQFKKSLSSPGYFRESLPHLNRKLADDAINELEEVNTCLLEAVEERESLSCDNLLEERHEPGILMSWTSGLSIEEGPKEDGSMNASPHENACSMFENIDTFSLTGSCKSSMQSEQQLFHISNVHTLPHPVHPKIRVKFQHQWQPPSLIDCDTKFGKAA